MRTRRTNAIDADGISAQVATEKSWNRPNRPRRGAADTREGETTLINITKSDFTKLMTVFREHGEASADLREALITMGFKKKPDGEFDYSGITDDQYQVLSPLLGRVGMSAAEFRDLLGAQVTLNGKVYGRGFIDDGEE
jgi:hypothetical protein